MTAHERIEVARLEQLWRARWPYGPPPPMEMREWYAAIDWIERGQATEADWATLRTLSTGEYLTK